MSELDSSRREALLEEIKDIQTIITCTGYDDFIKEQVVINNVYHVINGTVKKYKFRVLWNIKEEKNVK